MNHTGDIIIRTEKDAEKYQHITKVTGSVDISSEGVQLPNLSTVTGHVHISAKGVQLPLLKWRKGKRSMYLKKDGNVQIGCQVRSVEWWRKNGETLGERNGYSAAEIAADRILFEDLVK